MKTGANARLTNLISYAICSIKRPILPFLWCCAGSLVQAATPMVSLGDSHALALRSDGTVLAWGSDSYGQLGLGRPLVSASPVKVASLGNVRSIAGGEGHSLAVRQDGTVWAWGENGYGQLGDATTSDRSSPVQVQGLANATRVCAGGWHSVALRQDGTVWAWGNN
jgi:alpha-tubulin suppressor-like RCC1 family protein